MTVAVRCLRPVVAVVLVATFVTGCTGRVPAARAAGTRAAPVGATAPVDPAAWAFADRLAAPAYTADTTAAMVAGLARSGIGTYADPTARRPEVPVDGPADPLRLLDFQAHALAVGAWAGAGYTGVELDTAIGVPAGQPTTSQLLAGYVAAARTPGGALSRALMTGRNLLAPGVRFPAVVLVLFAADLAPGGPPATGLDTPAGLTVRRDGGICSAAKDWIDHTIAGFFAALRLTTPTSTAGAVVASIWNWLVDAAQILVGKLIGALTDAVLGTIRDIARMVAGAAEQIVSMLPYAVKVVGGNVTLGPAPIDGDVTATVSAGDLPDWPPVLADCAAVAQVRLPDFHAGNLPVTWGPLGAPAAPLLAGTGADHGVTGPDGRASWTYRTDPDPGDPRGAPRSQVDSMPVAVARPEVRQARDRLTYALLGSIPDLLRPYVARLFAPYVDGLESRLNALLDARGLGTVLLAFHGGPPPVPSPAATPAGCPVAPGTYTGTSAGVFHERIPMSGGALVDDNHATGPVTITVTAGGAVSGAWSFTMHDEFDETFTVAGITSTHHLARVYTMAGGLIAGTACDLGLTSGPVVLASCVGDCGKASGAAPATALPRLGPPVAGSGHLTWKLRRDAADGTYTDTFTIEVTGPR